MKKIICVVMLLTVFVFVSSLIAEEVKEYIVKKNVVEINSYKFPVFPGIKTVKQNSIGGIEYTITEKSVKAAVAKAKKVVAFYTGKEVGMYVIKSLHKVERKGVTGWYGCDHGGDTGNQVLVLVKDKSVLVYAIDGANEDMVLDEYAGPAENK